jgi:DNA-binding NarL/FixJ family response regulator
VKKARVIVSPLSVLVADPDSMLGRLLTDFLSRQSGFRVVGLAVDVAALLTMARRLEPDIALISTDLRDGPGSGIKALRELHALVPRTKSILLFQEFEPDVVVESLRAGARGLFLRNDFGRGLLRKCLFRVHEGQIWLGSEGIECVLATLNQTRPLRMNPEGANLLSRREKEVVQLVAEGLGNREIAERLELSEHTVKNYIFHIFDKLGLSSRVELVLYAVSGPERAELQQRLISSAATSIA